MTSIALKRTDVIVGVDTHKDEHVGVAIDGLGGRSATRWLWTPPMSVTRGYSPGRCRSATSTPSAWVAAPRDRPGPVPSSPRPYAHRGARPPRAGERRRSGKSDAIDAEHAARCVLAGTGLVIPKLADGQVEAIRLVKIALDTAVKAHSTAIITLKAVLVTSVAELRAELEPLPDFKLITAYAALDTSGRWATRRRQCGTRFDPWPAAGSSSTRRSRCTPVT